ncbi:hypothetical protein BDY17DRAFT_291653 [Neohortaea acidophila]|uniref:Uncharacterized protein n=1 Tax=Neohortaea acidophila TaxID=245834 RepID=A0A6A6Q1Z9_9PEZI|nr:uncharacterized protein BDY17DRAFT_291653 [Neohortaea acidophila]KAF2486528.1 hypothetical protein BDY17DRAFT_291653 [Neohortaea acidophila]
MPPLDLLALEDEPVNGSHEEHYIRTSAPTQSPPQKRPTPNYADMEDNPWDDFEPAAPTSPIIPPNNPIPKAEEALPPPTNIPPPAVLISLFPSLMAEADESLFTALGKMDLKQKQMLLAHPASHQFLKAYLGRCTVMAHIIAGRKSRWKRDRFLSQSMRIGPAAAGGKGGMKLAGIDKGEVAKEDREVVDVVRLWRNQVGKVRTAVSAASAAPGLPKLPAVPEIVEQMAVRVVKAGEGGITASHACALCGLKREERVAKVDVEVEDSFGEWWVDGLNMHTTCRTFWRQFEKKLKSR